MLTQSDLDQFCGTENYYRHPIYRNILYTDGVKYLADMGEANWLVDNIASALNTKGVRQAMAHDCRLMSMQFWTLKVSDDRSGVLVGRADSGCDPFAEFDIGFTDFPLKEAKVWVGPQDDSWVLFLPSEY